jgi:hypothetical protein
MCCIRAPATSTGQLTSTTLTSIAQRASPDAMEASTIWQANGYFYVSLGSSVSNIRTSVFMLSVQLFTSWDNCCKGTSSTYNIRVGRATTVTGPYTDKSGVSLLSGGGTQVLATHDSVSEPLLALYRGSSIKGWVCGLSDLRPRRSGYLLGYGRHNSRVPLLHVKWVLPRNQLTRLLEWLASGQMMEE